MTRAGIYSRISSDANLEGKGVRNQREDCEALCAKRGYTVVGVFEDNDISAAGRTKKERPQYAALLAAAKAGEIDVIVAYSNSRLTRRPRESEDLIELHQDHGTLINTVVSGDDDLSTADGRLMARLKGDIDAAEAERTSERLARHKAGRAAEGLPQGGGKYGRTFGFAKDWTVVQAEKNVIIEMFTRRAAGESTHAIAKDLASRDVRGVSGAVVKSTTVGHILTNPLYAGLRRYKGEVIGKSSLEAFVDESVFNAAQSAMQKSSRGTNTRKHLLTGILICGKCLSPMSGKGVHKAAGRGPHYKCAEHYGGCGNVSIMMEPVDAQLGMEARKLANMAEESVKPERPTRDFDAEIEAVNDKMVETRKAYQDGVLAMADATPILNDLRKQEAALKKEQASAVVEDTDILQLEPFKSGIEFDALNVSQKRVYISRYIESVVVAPWNPKEPYEWIKRLTFNTTDGHTYTRTQPRTPEELAEEVAKRAAARDAGEWIAP